MNKINTRTPSIMLASTVALLANTVGGYDGSFEVENAQDLLSDLFSDDEDDVAEAYGALRSIYDRVEGASFVAGRMADVGLSCEATFDPATLSVEINGVDTRKTAVDGVMNGLNPEMERATKNMVVAAETIQELSRKLDEAQGLLRAHGIVPAAQEEPVEETIKRELGIDTNTIEGLNALGIPEILEALFPGKPFTVLTPNGPLTINGSKDEASDTLERVDYRTAGAFSPNFDFLNGFRRPSNDGEGQLAA